MLSRRHPGLALAHVQAVGPRTAFAGRIVLRRRFRGRRRLQQLGRLVGLTEHGNDPAYIKHICRDMSPALAKGGGGHCWIPRLAMTAVISLRWPTKGGFKEQIQPCVVKADMGNERKTLKVMRWRMRKGLSDWNVNQRNTMYQLQRSNLHGVRIW